MVHKLFKQNQIVVFSCACLFGLLVALLVCLFLLLGIEEEEIGSSRNEHKAYLLADEFRQSSDDLTKMARLYVLTTDPKYFKWYQEILDIRNGLEPVPLHYNEVYWDLILEEAARPSFASQPVSLQKRIKDHEFSPIEVSLLSQAEAHSNSLAKIEIEAMNAVTGKFQDASGEYTIEGAPNLELARTLVSGKKYMEEKAKVMKPLQAFYQELEQRFALEHEKHFRQNKRIIFVSIVLLVSIVILLVFSLYRILKSFSKVRESNENLLLSALPAAISDRFKQATGSTIQECQASVLFLDVELSEDKPLNLGNLFQELFEQLDEMTVRFGVERIKTVQGTYMVVSGISSQEDSHVEKLARFALALKEKVKQFGLHHKVILDSRMGMASGTIIAGMLDHKRYIYDLSGDVLKEASKLESTAAKGEIQITKKMAIELKGSFQLVEKNPVEKIYLLQKYLE